MTAKKNQVAVIAGDVTMDWNIATSQGTRGAIPNWSPDLSSGIFWQAGGAAGLADLVEAVAASLPPENPWSVHGMDSPRQEVSPSDPGYHHSFTMWAPFKYSEKAPQEKAAWRVEHFLGIGRSRQDTTMQVLEDDPTAGLVVLDDGGLGFRDRRLLDGCRFPRRRRLHPLGEIDDRRCLDFLLDRSWSSLSHEPFRDPDRFGVRLHAGQAHGDHQPGWRLPRLQGPVRHEEEQRRVECHGDRRGYRKQSPCPLLHRRSARRALDALDRSAHVEGRVHRERDHGLHCAAPRFACAAARMARFSSRSRSPGLSSRNRQVSPGARSR